MSKRQVRVRVIVADDHPVFRRGLIESLKRRADIDVVGDGHDGPTALSLIETEKPDVAVLDVQMPVLSGLEVLEAARKSHPDTRVMLLTGFRESRAAYEAMVLGAAGYLAKESDIDRICDAIAAIARGETVIGDEFQSGLVEEIRLREAGNRPALSKRELEVLRLTADGNPIAAVAAKLHLSEATIKTHLHHIYGKLEVSDRAAAVASAMRWGLIE